MSNEITESTLLDDGGLSSAMRAEAATSANSANNWVMAALITTNGGASLALLGQDGGGSAKIIALGLYMLGVTAALIGGRLSANLANEEEALFVSSMALQRASLHHFRAARTGDKAVFERAQNLLKSREEDYTKQEADYDKAATPAPWLAAGIFFFFFGCIAAGFAIF